MDAHTIVSYWTGLVWLAPDMPWPTLWRTAVIIHVCDGIVCRIFAAKHGRPANLWLFLGLTCGIWAVIAMLVLPQRTNQRQQAPATRPT